MDARLTKFHTSMQTQTKILLTLILLPSSLPISFSPLDGYDDADLALALAGTGLDSMPEADAYDFYETYMDEEEVY